VITSLTLACYIIIAETALFKKILRNTVIYPEGQCVILSVLRYVT